MNTNTHAANIPPQAGDGAETLHVHAGVDGQKPPYVKPGLQHISVADTELGLLIGGDLIIPGTLS